MTQLALVLIAVYLVAINCQELDQLLFDALCSGNELVNQTSYKQFVCENNVQSQAELDFDKECFLSSFGEERPRDFNDYIDILCVNVHKIFDVGLHNYQVEQAKIKGIDLEAKFHKVMVSKCCNNRYQLICYVISHALMVVYGEKCKNTSHS